MVQIDPDVAGFTQQLLFVAGLQIKCQQIQLRLLPVENLGSETAVWQPLHPRQINILIVAQIQPLHLAALTTHHTQAHPRIGHTRKRITMIFLRRVAHRIFPLMHDAVDGNVRLVHLHKRQLLAVW